MTDPKDQAGKGLSGESSVNEKETVRPTSGPSEPVRVAIPRPSELKPLNALSSTPPPVDIDESELEDTVTAYLVDNDLLDDDEPTQTGPARESQLPKPAPLGVRSRFSTAPPKQPLASRSSAPAPKPSDPASTLPRPVEPNTDRPSASTLRAESPAASLPLPKSRPPTKSLPPPKSRPSTSLPPSPSRPPTGSLPPQPSLPPTSLAPRPSVPTPSRASEAPSISASLLPRVPTPPQPGRSALLAKRLTPAAVSKAGAHQSNPAPSLVASSLSSRPPKEDSAVVCPSAERLAETGQTAAWLARAAALETHANTQKDAAKKSRLLVVVSELYAQAGHIGTARAVAERAAKLGNHLAQRQARQLAQAAGDHKAASSHFALETNTAVTPETRRHSLVTHATFERWVRKDALTAARILEQVTRVAPNDPLPRLAKLGAHLGQELTPPAAAGPAEPESPEVAHALETVRRLRGETKTKPGSDRDPVATFLEVRRALERRDRIAAANAVVELQSHPGFERAAPWLAAALLAPVAATRKRAVELLASLEQKRSTRAVRRTLLARGLESGDNAAVAEALRQDAGLEPGERAFTYADQLALGALCHSAEGDVLTGAADWELNDDDRELVAAAALSTNRPELAGALGNLTAAVVVAAHRGNMPNGDADTISPPLLRLLSFERLESEGDGPGPEALLELSGLVEADGRGQLAFTAGVLAETQNDLSKARELFESSTGDPVCGEAALRGLLRTRDPEDASRLLESFAEHVPEADRKAEALVLAALRTSDAQRRVDLVSKAHGIAPDHVLVEASVLRLMPKMVTPTDSGDTMPPPSSPETANGTSASLTSKRLAILSHHSVSGDSDYMRALALLRHVFTKPSTATRATLLGHAWDLWPKDAALLDLRESFGSLPLDARAKARELLATSVTGPRSAAVLKTEAALFYELAGMPSSAARVAHQGEHGPALLEGCFGRNAPGTEFATAWRQKVLERAQSAEHSTDRAQYWLQVARLASDAGDWAAERDAVGRAIHLDPQNVEGLLSAEALAFKDGEVERIAEVERFLAEALKAPDHLAHAQLASRFLQLSAGSSSGYAPLCACVDDNRTPHDVARKLAYQAPRMGDDELGYRMYGQLLTTATRTADKAALLVRSAELAMRLGKTGTALTHLDDAIALLPNWVTALSMRAELLADGGYRAAAAEAYERLAQAAHALPLKAAAFKHAAEQLRRERPAEDEGLNTASNPSLLPVVDPNRLRLNLERALEADPNDEDVLEMLIDSYAQQRLDGELGELFLRRLEGAAPDVRQKLMLRWSQACSMMGSSERAFELVREVLKGNPDSAGALEQLASLTKDTAEREQTLLQLIRVAPTPGQQAAAYKHLGDFYHHESPQPARAIKSYQEALRRKPDDGETLRALVAVQIAAGDLASAKANVDAFAQRSNTDAERRAVAVSRAAITAATDPNAGEAELQQLLTERPYDSVVLEELAQVYVRENNTDKLRLLDERVRQQAERELPAGAHVAAYLSALAALAKLRADNSAFVLVSALSNLYHGVASGLDARGSRAVSRALDADLAPHPLSESLRTLLAKTSEALEEAFPLNIADLNPVPLKDARLVASFEMKAKAVGIAAPELFVVNSAPYLCQVTHHPSRVFLGSGWVEHAASLQDFVVWRSLKLLQARVGAVAHSSPESTALRLDALLSAYTDPADTLVPNASGPNRLRAVLHPLLPKDPTLGALAASSVEELSQSELEVGDAIALWADRSALLATGEPRIALLAVCLMHGETGFTTPAALLDAVARQPSARRLMVSLLDPDFVQAHRSIH